MSESLGLYLHVPFCVKKCSYCDFYSLADFEEGRQAYTDALCRELRQTAQALNRPCVDTVFFGGGTPSLLHRQQLSAIAEALCDFSLSGDCEISVEVNPGTVGVEELSHLRSLGVNRISIGMQSALDYELALLGRIHRYSDLLRCVEDVGKAGFSNFNLDLMYGLVDHTPEKWERTLDAALSLGATHLSLYALTLSESVALYRLRDRLPEDEAVQALYLQACERLSSAGYEQYEISNFSKKGFACRHNLRYWRRQDYLGFGPGAASCYRNRRYTVCPDLEAYLRSQKPFLTELLCEPEMGEEERLSEEIMLSLRLSEGLCVSEILPRIPNPEGFRSEIDRIAALGLILERDGKNTLTREGFFVSNEIITRLLLGAGLS